MDGRVYSLADVVDLGRDLCPGDDALRNMELYQRSTVLCQTYTTATKADHGDSVERCRWPSRTN